MRHSIDIDFLVKLEGGYITHGYVPDINNSNSGVTIGGGCDIGQYSKNQLMDIFVPEYSYIYNRLFKYAEKKQLEAKNELNKMPLLVDIETAKIITKKFMDYNFKILINRYNNNSIINFELLHPAIQTVISSVAYQYGNLQHRTPNFWNQAISLNIKDMFENLLDFKDKYSTRRKKEANYLNKYIQIIKD